MLFHVAGKLSSGKPFSTRVDASNAIEAAAFGKKALNDASVSDSDVSSVRIAPVAAKSTVHIGEPRKPKTPKTAATTDSAPATAPARKR